MVQREIADRLRAGPGQPHLRLAERRSSSSPARCELVRTVDPAVFRPRPRVESAILGLRRTGPGADPATRELVRAAFAHRRKSLPRSLEHVRPGMREAGARGARASSACPTTRAPRRSRPSEFAALAAKLARLMASTPPPSSTSASTSGRAAPDGLHELCSLFEPLALADLIEVARGGARRGRSAPGVEGENLAELALAALRERGWAAPAAADRDREADPGRRRARRRQRRRGRGAAARRGRGRRACRSSRPSSAPTCPRSSIPALALVQRRRRAGRAAARPGAARGRPAARTAAASAPPRSSPRPTGSGSAATPASSTEIARPAARGGRRRRLAARLRRSCSSTTSSRRRGRSAPEIGDALEALRDAGAGHAMLDRLRADRGRALARASPPPSGVAERARARRRDRLRGGGARHEAAGQHSEGVGGSGRSGSRSARAIVAGYVAFSRARRPREGCSRTSPNTLGAWTYLLVGFFAFAETGAFVGLLVPGETVMILGGAVAGQGATTST